MVLDWDHVVSVMLMITTRRDGEANAELLDFIKEVLQVKKTQVSLDKGAKARSKSVLVTELSTQEVYDRIKAAMAQDKDT